MAHLIAQGRELLHRWRRVLPEGKPFELGRSAGAWSVPWDEQVSARHVALQWREGRLQVRRLPAASNPIFFRGAETAACELLPGEHFVLGQTTFTVADDEISLSQQVPLPDQEQAFAPQLLRQLRYRDAQQRLEVLNRLPDLIRGAADDTDLFVRLLSLLWAGLPRATALALVAQQPGGGEPPPVRVLHWDQRSGSPGGFQPSAALIARAVAQKSSVLHLWKPAGTSAAGSAPAWAFCTPVPGDACRGWAVYVAGETSAAREPAGELDLQDELKFTQLVVSILGALRDVQHLQRQQDRLRPFFSPAVLAALAERPDAAQPREVEVTVLFCDLRGFSREAEKSAEDLLGLLRRVSGALGVMTRQILQQGGVFGDLQGDAAMGFWGWPISQPDAVPRGCRAALGIRAAFAAASDDPHHLLAGYRVGIGIASGRAVAGQIGTQDQVKVTVFGPVVNLASRLQELTKLLHAPILLDEATAAVARRDLARDEGRLRRVARVQPYGLSTALEISELLPPAGRSGSLTDAQLAAYESALDALTCGDWSAALEWLHRVPAADRVKDFLTRFILEHHRTPPENFDGVIRLLHKG